jgi:cobalt-zinc-cadmium resistance protein CzcA
MFDAIIAFSLRQRALILLLTLALVAGGIASFNRLPIDAVPDITNNQVQILTSAPSLSAPEVERYVTFPIEAAVKSLPDIIELRSISQLGLSVITVVFKDNVDTYFARQQVLEKLREAEETIPADVERPELAPVSTGLGEIFRYVVRDTTGRLSAMDLRTVQDWIIRRGLLGTPGLAEVNSLGGYVKQYHILVNSDALVSFGLTLRDLFDAVARTSGNAGGAYIETGPEQLAIRSVGLATGIDDLRATVLRATPTGTPILLRDVATVEIGSAIRFGSASQDGKGEVVTGITMQLKGKNARLTVNAVKERIKEITGALPPGVVIEPYYDREVLVDRTISTVLTNLIEGALLVIFILLLFLVNLRAGIILASVIPLSMMFAGILMLLTGQSGNLMSLGAIDFGLVVDGSLIIVENILRILDERLQKNGGAPLSDRQMKELIYAGSIEVRKAAQFGEIIIIVVYLPILTLQGIEGKLFKPMALTVAYALLGALILSITYVPVMLSLFMKRSGRIRHSPIITLLARLYKPMLQWALRMRVAIIGTTLLLLAGAVVGFMGMGGEFIPRLDEGDIAMHLIRLPSVSLTESQKITNSVERELMKFQEVRTVVSSTGRAEISTDPMGFDLADAFVMLKPRDEWTSLRSKEELIEAMERVIAGIPGVGVQFLQPISMRTNELIAGARGDVVIKVTGEDYELMSPAAEKITKIVQGTQGSADVTMEQTSGLPQLLIRPDRQTIARYGLSIDDVNQIVGIAIAGRKATEVAEGEQRFDVVIRLPLAERSDVASIKALMVATPTGQRIPLSELASVTVENGPAQINREDGSRFMTVQANVRGRDVKSFVEEVQDEISRTVKLPPGYNITYGGEFENLEAASARLFIVVPIALALIFLLLFQTFGSMRLGMMIFLCVPMAVIGGVAGLLIAGLPFSISAGVGFIALFGIAVLNGIVMVAAIRKFQGGGVPRREAVIAGAAERLRPVLTTAALAGFGFLPMLLASGAGAEVQRPLATVIIGGLISSTLLTLFVLPLVYDWLGGEHSEGDGEDRDDSEIKEKGRSKLGRAGVVAIIMLVLSAGIVAAQTPITRQSIRERTISTAPEVGRAESVIAARRGARAGESILPNPEIFLGVDEAPSPGLTGRSNARVGLAQSFAWPGVYAARGRVGDILIEAAGADREGVIRALRRRADVAYCDLVATRWLVELADSSVRVAKEFSRLAALRRELGETPALESLQAAMASTSAARHRSEAEMEYQRSLALVLSLMNLSASDVILPADTFAYRTITTPLATLEQRMVAANPELQSARLVADAAKAEEDVVGYQKSPEFTLEYALQTVDGNGGFYGGSIRIGLPLWRWMNDGPDEAAHAERSQREDERAITERSLRTELRRAYAGYTTSQRLVADYHDNLLPQASEAYSIARRLFTEGGATYLEVLMAQSALLELRSSYVIALWNAERMRVDIESLVGEDVR